VEDPDRRRQLGEDDAAWLRYYFGDVFYNPFTDDQLEIIHDCGEVLKYGLKKCKAAPRGDGKSSIVKYLMLKYALYRQVRFPLVIAATGGKAKGITGSLKRKLAAKKQTPFSRDFPLECYVAQYVDPWPSRAKNVTANGGRSVHVEWGTAEGHFILPTWEDEEAIGPIIKAIGWSSDELQGCNVYDMRPDCLMLDDLDSRDSLAAEDGVVAGKIEEAIEKTIAGLKGQSRKLGQYYLCTITSTKAAAYKYSDPKQKPAWGGSRKAAIKTWPTNIAMWDKYVQMRQKGMQDGDPNARDAHNFYLANREAMDEGAEVSNPYNFEADLLEDGSQKEVSNLQNSFNFIADGSREAFDTEYQNDPPKKEDFFENKVSPYVVSSCAGEYQRKIVDSTSDMITRAIDVRKIELHHATLSVEKHRNHRIPDYDIQTHGSSETTVEQAEDLILGALHKLADDWEENPICDEHGTPRTTDLCLVDKGWVGNWTEDGTVKTWVTQPVEQFCMERGLRRWLPAKGQPNYRTPEPSDKCIVGDNWHMNRGNGETDDGKRSCTEVIWNASHWHLLVEELFLLPEDSVDRFELFEPTDGIFSNHKAFGEHIKVGAEQLKQQLTRGTRSRKPRFVRDHWWDSVAMALVAKSIERWFRGNLVAKKPPRGGRPGRQSHSQPQEIGAR
jgi:hypothetical protein